MLLPLYHNHPSFSSKSLDHFLSPSPKPLFSLQNPRTPKSLPFTARSASPDAETVTKTAIQRIAEKLRNLGYVEELPQPQLRPNIGPGTPGEIFIPAPHQLPKHRVGHTIDNSWSSPESPVPDPGSGVAVTRFHELRAEELRKRRKGKTEAPPTVAELTLPAEELRRLQSVGIRLRKKLKIGKAGITEGIVNGIHERWRRSELVKIKCEDLCRINMKRTHEMLERKTGGLVVWRSGSIIILYRGANYEYPYFLAESDRRDEYTTDNISSPNSSKDDDDVGGELEDSSSEGEDNSLGMVKGKSPVEPLLSIRSSSSSLVSGVGSPNKVRFQLPGEVQLEEEADQLLEGLGPRFTDWWGNNPVPIDADLLPPIIPGYRKPFRLLPYGVNPKLTDREMTTLRRLGKPLPCHFALGRNKNLQGLAMSIIKLWEKCEIAKIAIKRGVQNTNSLMMAEELKKLTGGTLIFRNVELIVLYRGKDFLPPAVSSAIEERRHHGVHALKMRTDGISSTTSTLTSESSPAKPFDGDKMRAINDQKGNSALGQRKLRRTTGAISSLDAKLSLALEKKTKAEKLLEKLEKVADPAEPEVDKEGITEEERYMLRKVGLRMKPFLLMGRRGVFDGTIENMHLHWKYRELVKVISKDRNIQDVHRTARALEAESGGILVAVERVSKGHAIIVYRGKNYKRPTNLRPQTLLNKKQALKRSLEAQRRESLKLHILELTKSINQMKVQLVKDENANSSQAIECREPTANCETSSPGSLESSCQQENFEDDGECADGSLSHSIVSSCDGEKKKTPATLTGSTSHGDNMQETPEVQARTALHSAANDSSCVSSNELRASSIDLNGKQNGSSFHKDEMKDPFEIEHPSRVVQLTNRDRLVLRKQALKMKKRPVLAVGRNNVVTGVAKAINTHFQKHPLAIVNIKGRAKGTSVEEVVFQLEKATDSVLVSREPNKVILYKGWGEGEEPEKRETRKGGKSKLKDGVSPQLLAAIKIECGLQGPQENTATFTG